MFGFLKKLLGGGGEPEKPSAAAPAPAAKAPAATSVDLSGAGSLVDCSGLDWNGAGQLEFAEVLSKHANEKLTTLLASEKFAGNSFCTPLDAAVIFAILSEYEPTRLMEVGSGYSTMALRHAMKVNNLPAELISVDPEPRTGIGEYVDAELFMRVQEVPVDDFRMLQAGELVLFDTTHKGGPESEIDYITKSILPELEPGVIVGFHGIRLPRNYGESELREGFAEQKVLLDYLCSSGRAEVFFSGGWMLEHHRAKLEAVAAKLAGGAKAESSALWFRIK
jgi:hypothetical protein